MEGGDCVQLFDPSWYLGNPQEVTWKQVSHRVVRGTLPLSCSFDSKVYGFPMIIYTNGLHWKHDGELYACCTGSIAPALWHQFKKETEVKYAKQSILK